MRKFMTFILAAAIVFTAALPAYAADVTWAKDVSLGEIQSVIEDYLAENGIDMDVESRAFYDFSVEQILGEGDVKLKKIENYDLVIEYMAEFKNTYGDYLILQDLLAEEEQNEELIPFFLNENDCITYNEETEQIGFSLSKRFKNMTIGDIVERNKKAGYAESKVNTLGVMPMTIASYTPADAAKYATQYANGKNVLYPYYSGSDCTNFVSQCLKAGGLPMVGSNSKTGIYDSTSKWYCICTESSTINPDKGRKYAVTTSWIRVSDFNTYWTSKAKSKTTKASASTLNSSCAVGDVVQVLSAAGTPEHSVIISKKTNGKAYYCGHSNNASDKDVSNLFGNGNKVLLFDLT